MTDDVQTQAASIRDEILQLVNDVDRAYFTIGGKLSAIARSGLHEGWGFDSFEEYIENELGFARRKAYYLIAIYEKAEELGVVGDEEATEALTSIGWTKAKEIINYVENRDDFNEWVSRAGTMSVSKLQENLKVAFMGAPVLKKGKDAEGNKTLENEDGEVFHILEIPLADAQYENVKLAMQRASEIASSDKPGHIIDMMALEFLSNNASLTNLNDKIAEWVNRGFIAFEEEDDEEATDGGES